MNLIDEVNKKPEVCKALLEELISDVSEYGEQWEIIENPELKWFSEGDAPYLLAPYAVKWIMPHSKEYLGLEEDYFEIIYLNHDYDGLDFHYEDIESPVHSGWLFIGYAEKLKDKIRMQQFELSRTTGDKYSVN